MYLYHFLTNLCLDEEGSLIKVEASSKYSKAAAWKYLTDRNTKTCSSCKSDKFIITCKTKTQTHVVLVSQINFISNQLLNLTILSKSCSKFDPNLQFYLIFSLV